MPCWSAWYRNGEKRRADFCWVGLQPSGLVLPKPSTQTISLRLPEHLLDRVKAAVNAPDVPYPSQIKVWQQEKVITG